MKLLPILALLLIISAGSIVAPETSMLITDTTVVINYNCNYCPTEPEGTPSLLETSTSTSIDDSYDGYIFTGTSNTNWTFSSIASVSKTRFYLMNKGTANVSVSGSNGILNSDPFILHPGEGYVVIKSSTQWILL